MLIVAVVAALPSNAVFAQNILPSPRKNEPTPLYYLWR